MRVDKFIEEIKKNYTPDDEILCIYWTERDIISRESELYIILTREERKQVLRMIEKDSSAEIGINWDIIDHYIEKIYSERNK